MTMSSSDKHAPGSFADVYKNHIWDIYGFFGYRVASVQHAEDLSHATFERALRAWSRFDPSRASVQTWLFAIARNILIDHYRKAPKSGIEPLELEDDSSEQSLTASARDAEPVLGPSPELAEALACLSEREREIVALRFGGDMSGAQIADVMGLSLSNVQQILSRSLRRLREELGGSEMARVREAKSEA